MNEGEFEFVADDHCASRVFRFLPRWKLRVFERFSKPNDLTDLSKKPTSLTFVVEVPKQGHEQ